MTARRKKTPARQDEPVPGAHYFYAVSVPPDGPRLVEVEVRHVTGRDRETDRPTFVTVCDPASPGAPHYIMSFGSLYPTPVAALRECLRSARRYLPGLVRDMLTATRDVLDQEQVIAQITAMIEAHKRNLPTERT